MSMSSPSSMSMSNSNATYRRNAKRHYHQQKIKMHHMHMSEARKRRWGRFKFFLYNSIFNFSFSKHLFPSLLEIRPWITCMRDIDANEPTSFARDLQVNSHHTI